MYFLKRVRWLSSFPIFYSICLFWHAHSSGPSVLFKLNVFVLGLTTIGLDLLQFAYFDYLKSVAPVHGSLAVTGMIVLPLP